MLQLGRVVQADPLRVQVNGDLTDTAAAGPPGLTVGAEVLVATVEGRRFVVYAEG